MGYLTFGEQVKIVLSRKGMTIKELAEKIEQITGKKMSRQNLTQRLGRDNFQEQDMRMIAQILECPFTLDIMAGVDPAFSAAAKAPEAVLTPASAATAAAAVPAKPYTLKTPEETTNSAEAESSANTETGHTSTEDAALEEERDITIGELYDIHQELTKMETGEIPAETIQKELADDEILQEEFEEDLEDEDSGSAFCSDSGSASDSDDDFEPILHRDDEKEDLTLGEANPYTGHEYQSNSVRMHPKRIGYVQVYDRSKHGWTDMTEWAFLGYQERKKALLGKKYEPPIYLD